MLGRAALIRPVRAQAGFTVLPHDSFLDGPAMGAYLLPGAFGTRQELHDVRLRDGIRSLIRIAGTCYFMRCRTSDES